jgi:hypothetical protein
MSADKPPAGTTHGATSSVQIARRAGVERRRILRQIGLRQSDLSSVGRALLLNWSRAAAALSQLDAYAAEHGWLKPDGEPRGFAKLYVAVLNSERLALRSLEEHIRQRPRGDTIEAVLAEYEEVDDG